MADVYDYVVDTGVILTQASDILTEVQAEYQAAFGDDLNLAPNTPQGILITTETLARTAVADNNAALANQINPNLAGGVFLDAILALLGSARVPATPSTALCTITGVVGTSIPAGAQISDGTNYYQLQTTTVIPSGGSISGVIFTSVILGDVPGVANTLTTIVSNILGWETVNNPDTVTQGSTTQSDAAARLYRLNTLALQGTSIAQAMTSAFYAIPGVNSLSFLENATSSPATVNDVPMVANSIYACCSPGSASLLDIATAFTNTKSAGAAYNNGLGIPQSINVTNPYSAQTIAVLFDTPSFVTIQMTITVHAFTSVQNVQAAVIAAIQQYAAGGIPGEAGFVVGASVSPFQIAGAINILVPGLFVQEVQIATFSFTQQGTLANTMNTVTGLTYNAPVGGFIGIATGMGVTDPLGYLPSATTVSTLVGSTGLTLNHNATGSATEILTFSVATPSLQTTEIPIAPWQQAVINTALITVIQV
jgi:hypothetical protein